MKITAFACTLLLLITHVLALLDLSLIYACCFKLLNKWALCVVIPHPSHLRCGPPVSNAAEVFSLLENKS